MRSFMILMCSLVLMYREETGYGDKEPERGPELPKWLNRTHEGSTQLSGGRCGYPAKATSDSGRPTSILLELQKPGLRLTPPT